MTKHGCYCSYWCYHCYYYCCCFHYHLHYHNYYHHYYFFFIKLQPIWKKWVLLLLQATTSIISSLQNFMAHKTCQTGEPPLYNQGYKPNQAKIIIHWVNSKSFEIKQLISPLYSIRIFQCMSTICNLKFYTHICYLCIGRKYFVSLIVYQKNPPIACVEHCYNRAF